MSTTSPANSISTLETTSKPPVSGFWVAILLALTWVLALAILTWSTANPVTLNRQQILGSEIVLVGRLVPLTAQNQSRNLVEPVPDTPWPLASREPISVVNLPETQAHPGDAYLFPLTRRITKEQPAAGEYLITPTHLPDLPPLIYPATREALQQLDTILSSAGREQELAAPTPPAARD